MHPAQLSPEQLLTQCEQRYDRRGGPGGQHRNKVETAVILTHLPSGIVAEANERRSQAANKRQAIFRLRLALATQFRSTASQQLTPPTQLWHIRTAGRRLSVAATHDDFPALLAELLDGLAAAEFDLPKAGDHFGVSSSQLTKLLRNHPPALAACNQVREQKGLRKLS